MNQTIKDIYHINLGFGDRVLYTKLFYRMAYSYDNICADDILRDFLNEDIEVYIRDLKRNDEYNE